MRPFCSTASIALSSRYVHTWFNREHSLFSTGTSVTKFYLRRFHPGRQFLFSIALIERVHRRGLFLGERVLLQLEHAALLLVGQLRLRELCRQLMHAEQVLAKLAGCAYRGCAGIVELVHQ